LGARRFERNSAATLSARRLPFRAFVDPAPLVPYDRRELLGSRQKYIRCTRSLGEDIFFAAVIGKNEQEAREMTIDETNKKYCGHRKV
jgi:hypothetical protein